MAIFIDERTLRDLSKHVDADVDELEQDSEEEFEVNSDDEAGSFFFFFIMKQAPY